MELPVSFLENMKKLLSPEEFNAYLDSYSEERVYGLRVNTNKLTPEEFEKICPFEIKKIPWIDNGYYYSGKDKPAKDPYYYAGLYYLQEPSAMTPAHVLPIEPDDRVLDICAAPGGKSTELAAKLKGKGVLVSNDISNSRAKALLKNLELFGISNAYVISEAPYKLAEHFEGYFDKILIDAPCSGEGMFRKEPSVMKSWVEHGNDYFVKLQQEITSYALKMLRPGGMLLYSTCTFSPLEDEQIVSRMLKEDPDLELVEPEWYEGFDHGHPEWSDNNQELTKCVRIWPHRMKGEGHFLALLKKKGESSRLKERQTEKAKMPQELFDFLQTVKKPLALDRLEIRQEKVFVHPDCRRDLKGLRIMRSGLLLGECLKNRFEPSQALAMALRADEYPNVLYLSREDDRVIRYLKGETIDLKDEESVEKGWVLICVDNYPLGFGKAAGGSVKNKYLAGWRWM